MENKAICTLIDPKWEQYPFRKDILTDVYMLADKTGANFVFGFDDYENCECDFDFSGGLRVDDENLRQLAEVEGIERMFEEKLKASRLKKVEIFETCAGGDVDFNVMVDGQYVFTFYASNVQNGYYGHTIAYGHDDELEYISL